MARGFLSGAVVGAVVSVGAVGLASILADAPPAPEMAVSAPVSEPAPDASQTDTPQVAGDADLATEAGAPKVPEPAADDVAALSDAGTDTPVRPETGGTSGIDAPETPTAEGSVEVQTDAPVLPSPQAALPSQPDTDELSISTEPAQPPAPEVAADSGFESVSPEAQAEAPAATAQVEPPVSDAPATAPAGVQEPASDDSPVAQEDTAPTPLLEQRVGSLVDRDEPPASDPAPAAAAPELKPIDAYAYVPDIEVVDPDKPMMSIVLIDNGADLSGGTVGLAALRSFPYPLSFAIDANLPDAAERSAAYRAEGLEVLAMIDLPAGATPADAEVSIAAALNAVPQAIGVLEGTGTGFQADRALSDQVVSILGSDGYGIVMQSKGLNTAQKLAVRDGVPAATVFRDFDSADQTPTVIRRFLDQAAFRAGQEGGVIMLGRVRPDTISALLLWGLQDRAERVALTPVSALLKAQVGE
ncbi:divergent polysaccharide deacetylase family protein [Pseudosulfitobacter sp. DSM 107133]|uniref:divergent polysaccharide deacteylase family protein n=1 Tax=Pseudosulfitobacter sp. DSM 107133 TaxID=2883100 RepID=UPI000DF43BC1|nr:divergent polysaccharide deacetylase family protein [Pseudosulfitobacter sp. DSM 107133]UOA27540.1 hypothetical protein DSM107133_02269 [Pseudosulfitobacter sp. DSM 107133]